MGFLVAFLALYNMCYPRNFLHFIHEVFKYLVAWHRIFEDSAERNHGTDSDFGRHWFRNIHRRYFEENVFLHFIISFGFILLI